MELTKHKKNEGTKPKQAPEYKTLCAKFTQTAVGKCSNNYT